MTERYENVIKKKKRKVKRVVSPTTIGDYLDNMTLDLKNYSMYADRVEKDVEKLRWFGYQLTDNLKQIVTILRERGIYKSVREKEQL